MLTHSLKVGEALELLAAIVLARALAMIGVPLWLALSCALLLPIAVHGVPLGCEFVIGALIDRRPISRLGPMQAIRLWWGETWRSFKVFNVDQAWRSTFAERTITRDANRPAVLLVHGYMCNRGTWRHWLVRAGVPAHWNIATVNLEPMFGPVEKYGEGIHSAVEQLRSASGAERVTLVCHSMGGLAARSYLRSHGHHAVQRVVTIDTPHNGTVFARFGQGRNARQMRHACDFVQSLAADDEPVEFVCFASQHDNLIVPRDNQVLPCAEAVWFEQIGHLAMTANDAVLEKLIEVVERPQPVTATVQASADAV